MRSYILEHISNNIFELVYSAVMAVSERTAKESFTSLSKYINEMEGRLFKQAGNGMQVVLPSSSACRNVSLSEFSEHCF